MVKYIYFIILLFLFSCGQEESDNQNIIFWTSIEKNNIDCPDCLISEFSREQVLFSFNAISSNHNCGFNSFRFRNIINQAIIIPNNGSRTEYNIELLSNDEALSDCLRENMILTLEKKDGNLLIQLDNDLYLNKESKR